MSTFQLWDCQRCRVRRRCTRSQYSRKLTLQPQAQYTVLRERRQFQDTLEFQKLYNQRAGIEGTLSQGVRRSALRKSRYIGLAKTHLQHILIATALNLIRLDAWLTGAPLAPTRCSQFMELQPRMA